MGSIILSIVIFIIALFLFIRTLRTLNNIKSEVIIKEARVEMDALITEFNRAAARNIDLIEERIDNLKDAVQKANQKMLQLDQKIEAAKQVTLSARSFLKDEEETAPPPKKTPTHLTYEKHRIHRRIEPEIIENKETIAEAEKVDSEISPPKIRKNIEQSPERDEKYSTPEQNQSTIPEPEPPERSEKLRPQEEPNQPEIRNMPEEQPAVNEIDRLPRSERLKEYLRAGKTKDELLEMGFMENEINLLSFLIRGK